MALPESSFEESKQVADQVEEKEAEEPPYSINSRLVDALPHPQYGGPLLSIETIIQEAMLHPRPSSIIPLVTLSKISKRQNCGASSSIVSAQETIKSEKNGAIDLEERKEEEAFEKRKSPTSVDQYFSDVMQHPQVCDTYLSPEVVSTPPAVISSTMLSSPSQVGSVYCEVPEGDRHAAVNNFGLNQNFNSSSSRLIILKSCDGEEFPVAEQVAREFKVVGCILNEDETAADNPIPLPMVSGKILSRLVDFCKHQIDGDQNNCMIGSEIDGCYKNQPKLDEWEENFFAADDESVLNLVRAAGALGVEKVKESAWHFWSKQLKKSKSNKTIKLKSVEGEEFLVPEAFVIQSALIRRMVDGGIKDRYEIILPAKTLAKVMSTVNTKWMLMKRPKTFWPYH